MKRVNGEIYVEFWIDFARCVHITVKWWKQYSDYGTIYENNK